MKYLNYSVKHKAEGQSFGNVILNGDQIGFLSFLIQIIKDAKQHPDETQFEYPIDCTYYSTDNVIQFLGNAKLSIVGEHIQIFVFTLEDALVAKYFFENNSLVFMWINELFIKLYYGIFSVQLNDLESISVNQVATLFHRKCEKENWNKLSRIELFTDCSGRIVDFDDDTIVFGFDNLKELVDFLKRK